MYSVAMPYYCAFFPAQWAVLPCEDYRGALKLAELKSETSCIFLKTDTGIFLKEGKHFSASPSLLRLKTSQYKIQGRLLERGPRTASKVVCPGALFSLVRVL